MREKEESGENVSDFFSQKETVVNSVRMHVKQFMSDNGMTISDFAEYADISTSTINTLLYGRSRSCQCETAISIARALSISVDELIGANTFNGITLKNIQICRSLPENHIYLIRWFINHQATLYKQDNAIGKKIISIMNPLHTNDGMLKVTNNFTQIDISHLNTDIKDKVFFGLKLDCDWYMPIYSPFDILLLANDRMAFQKEHVVILIGENIFLARQRYENGHYNYYGIRDDKFRCDESGISEVIGYVTGLTSDTSEIGRR